jgi:DNA-binding XRE family transcriptional regulator
MLLQSKSGGCGSLVALAAVTREHMLMLSRTVPDNPLRGRFELGTWAHPNAPHAPPGMRDTYLHPGTARPLLSWRLSFWLNEIRFQAGLTQHELAGLIETTQPALSKWETGRSLISLDTLGRLGDCAGIPVALYASLPANQTRSVIWL